MCIYLFSFISLNNTILTSFWSCSCHVHLLLIYFSNFLPFLLLSFSIWSHHSDSSKLSGLFRLFGLISDLDLTYLNFWSLEDHIPTLKAIWTTMSCVWIVESFLGVWTTHPILWPLNRTKPSRPAPMIDNLNHLDCILILEALKPYKPFNPSKSS